MREQRKTSRSRNGMAVASPTCTLTFEVGSTLPQRARQVEVQFKACEVPALGAQPVRCEAWPWSEFQDLAAQIHSFQRPGQDFSAESMSPVV